ncbi:MAG: transcription elongation factor Spt5 [Candidatus Aenigmarchaeota archaeon]|nr:transcription elongation factor Spt5 [Candidatus Aenigmarchaeota archaeon]
MISIIVTIRTTTGRENVVIESIMAKVKHHTIPIRSIFHPTELSGYVFIEGEINDIEASVKGIPHVRGLINKDVPMTQLERFLVAEKQQIKVETGDVVEIVGGPFKGEKGKVTRVDETKNELTVEFLDAAIPIPVTISVNSIRIYEKKKE